MAHLESDWHQISENFYRGAEILITEQTATFCTEIPLYASSISVHIKCHPAALTALYSTELFHTLTAKRKHSSAEFQNQSYSRIYFSLCGL
jgi:hypothetical protein